LRPLPVDLEELAGILEGDPVYGGGRIDLRTGEVWPQAVIDYAREEGEEDPDDEDPDRWLPVSCEGSQAAYGDMVDFIEALSDEDRADRLSIAISGRGAFRRFKDVVARRPDDLERWYAFSGERQRGRARAWFVSRGTLSRSGQLGQGAHPRTGAVPRLWVPHLYARLCVPRMLSGTLSRMFLRTTLTTTLNSEGLGQR
jgi:hypothetical protein